MNALFYHSFKASIHEGTTPGGRSPRTLTRTESLQHHENDPLPPPQHVPTLTELGFAASLRKSYLKICASGQTLLPACSPLIIIGVGLITRKVLVINHSPMCYGNQLIIVIPYPLIINKACLPNRYGTFRTREGDHHDEMQRQREPHRSSICGAVASHCSHPFFFLLLSFGVHHGTWV